MSKSWYSLKAAINGNDPEILIYDHIGSFGVSARQFNEDLEKLKGAKRLTLRINSPGGDVFIGIAIINMLQRYKARYGATITVYVDGLAASMASAVAMVGDTVIMPSNAVLMIHDPNGWASGRAKSMRDMADLLDKLKTSMVKIYATKSGKTETEVEDIMAAETWYDADGAVEAGFADEVEDEAALAAVFDISGYEHPPTSYGGDPVGGPADSTSEESPMTTQNQQETPAEMEARIRKDERAKVEAEAAAKAKADAAAAATVQQPQQAGLNAVEVAAACKLAGLADMTTEMLAKATMTEVLAALEAKKGEGARDQQTTDGLQARIGADGKPAVADEGPKPEAIDTSAIYAKFNGKRAA